MPAITARRAARAQQQSRLDAARDAAAARRKAEAEAELAELQERARRRKAHQTRVRIIRRIIIGAALILCGAALLWWELKSDASTREEEGAEMKNTQIEYVNFGVPQQLAKRADGSYFTKTTNADGYDVYTYNPISAFDGAVSEGEIATGKRGASVIPILSKTEDPIRIGIEVIDESDPNQTPRLERRNCTLKPIDPNQPSYKGDPTGLSTFSPGSDREHADAGDFLGISFAEKKRVCVNEAVFRVPDGSIQP